ncbi:MAG: AI-2E family transporter [Pseudomonadota bacterium]
MNTSRIKWQIWLGFFVHLLLVYLLSSVLTPFVIAAFLAYVMNPLVKKLILFYVPRTVAVIVVFVAVLLLVGLLCFLLIPLLEKQIVLFINQIPVYLNWIQAKVLPLLDKYFGISQGIDANNIKRILMQHWQQAGNIATLVIKTITQSTFSIIQFVIYLVLIPVVAFYLLRDWHNVWRGVRDLLPRSIEPTVTRLTFQCNEVIGAFFRGQLIVMIALGVFYSIVLSLLGLQLALLLGFVIGLISVVPYLGFTIGLLVTLLVAYLQFGDWLHIIYVLLIFGFGNILEGMILTPWLVGDKIGLHPVAVIFAVLAGGELFGFLGVLLALPVAAVIMVLLRHVHDRYRQSEVYQAKSTES